MVKYGNVANVKKDNRYSVYHGMRSRCSNPKNRKYPIYGGRGITVCDRWLGPNGFYFFCLDMGERPVDETSKTGALCSIDRIDNGKGYSPENCRWATAVMQNNNRRPRA